MNLFRSFKPKYLLKREKKSVQFYNDETEDPAAVQAERERCIDRRPAWIKSSCAFLMLASHYGILNVGALFYTGLEETLNVPISKLFWLMTGQFAITCCLAPVYNRLLDLVATRLATIIAVILTSAAMIASVFFRNYFGFFVMYTLLGGIGMGISIVRVIAVMAGYFDRYRIFALAFCSSSGGFGTLMYSLLCNYMIENYTWRMAIILLALIHLNVIPLSLLHRPLPNEPIPLPTILLPNDPVTSTICLKSITRLPNTYASFISTTGGSVLTSIDNIAQKSKSQTTHLRITGQDIIGVVEFIKITFDKTDSNQLTVSPINFISDPEPHILERIQTLANDYFDYMDTTKGSNSSNNLTLFLPIIFVVYDQLSEFRNNLPESQILVDSHLGGIDNLFTGRTYHTESNTFINTLTSIEETPNVNKPITTLSTATVTKTKSTPFFGDSVTSSIIKASDTKYTENFVRAVIRRALTKVKEISRELTSKNLLVHPKPITVIVEEKCIHSMNPNFLSENHPCYLRHSKPTEETILEETESDYQTDENHEFNKALAVEESSQTTAQNNRIISSEHRLANSYLNLHQPKVPYGSRGYIDQMIHSGTTIYQNQGMMVPLYRCEELAGRTRVLSVTSVNEPEEAVKLLLSKIDNKSVGDDPPNEEMKKARMSFINMRNILFLSFLMTRLSSYMADSILYGHFINFAISSGLKEDLANGLLAYIGISNMLCRITIGLVGQFFHKLEIRLLVSGCLLILSIHTIFMPFYPSYPALIVYGISYSLFVGPSFAFSNAMTIEIMGTQNMDRNLSMVLFFEATGYLIGGPLGGIIKDQSGNYAYTFLFSGFCSIISAVIITVHALIKFNTFKTLKRYICKNNS
ncbi:Monocarboxylate transporter 14 [Schistosoma japonicum]|uniref:Monocarboxylate transporter 14 n=1 Tax=Schistosoma japonicum TaxID=6182 RepID=A0A4Z2D8M0_SCHJA|nr:Monocarboxylate transporter 14 [Schistosoma japonicum]